MKTIVGLFLGALLSATSAAVAASPADPVIGTWELNVSKSKFSAALGPAPKSSTRTYSLSTDGMMSLTINTVSADGKENTVSMSYKLDGQDYPVKGAPAFDSISVKRMNSHTVEFSTKKAGKQATMGRRTVSKDGKTLTHTVTGTDKTGAKFQQTEVYDKQ
jgi:hypothetical protein